MDTFHGVISLKKGARKRKKGIVVVKHYEKIPEIFENICILITFVQPENFLN